MNQQSHSVNFDGKFLFLFSTVIQIHIRSLKITLCFIGVI